MQTLVEIWGPERLGTVERDGEGGGVRVVERLRALTAAPTVLYIQIQNVILRLWRVKLFTFFSQVRPVGLCPGNYDPHRDTLLAREIFNAEIHGTHCIMDDCHLYLKRLRTRG